MSIRHTLGGLAALALLPAGLVTPAAADAVADFYRGKTVTMIVGAGAGGGYGLNARILGNHLGKHIPGNPAIVLQFMQGSGGVKAANYMYNVAARDGSVISVPISSIVENQLLRPKGVKFDGAKFNWLGSITSLSSVLSVWHTAPAKTMDEAVRTEVVLGSPSGHSFIYRMPKLMNALLDTKFKIVVGYKGGRGVEMALERGEIQGRAMVWASTKVKKANWLKAGKLVHLVQIGPYKLPDLPNVPRFVDLVKTDKEKTMVKFLHITGLIGRALQAPPGVPADRVAALRAAFTATMKDPAFVAEIKKRKLPLNPSTGEEMQSFIEGVMGTSPKLIAELKAALASK